jgi:hypothetical protein
MNNQAYASTYRSAMEAARLELDGLFEEAKRLRNRMEQIDSAISALKPLLGEGQSASEGGHSRDMSADAVPMKEQIDSALGLVFA